MNADKVPPEVLRAAKLRVLDIVGAMLGGKATELVRQTEHHVFNPENGTGTPVVAYAKETGVASAALLQGTMACVLEYDDTHVRTGNHPSSPVVAATLAKGAERGLSGRRIIEAVLVGNELACRLGLVAPGHFHRVGFHPTAMFGGFGATYAIARLTNATEAEVVSAIGLCASFSSGIMASWEDGSSAKSLHAGWAASSAIQAVSLARNGVSGPVTAYEGRFGFFRSHLQSVPDDDLHYAAIEARLGQSWEILNIAPRAFACGHYIQPFLDAALTLVQQNDVPPGDVAKIECSVADYMVPLICEPAAEKLAPATSWHARYSLPFCIAECVVRRSFTKHSLALADLTSDAHLKLASKVSYRIDPSAADRTQWSGEVAITFRDGRKISHRVQNMRGTAQNPMTEDDLVKKFMHNAEGILTISRAEQVSELLLNLDRVDDVRHVLSALAATN